MFNIGSGLCLILIYPTAGNTLCSAQPPNPEITKHRKHVYINQRGRHARVYVLFRIRNLAVFDSQ